MHKFFAKTRFIGKKVIFLPQCHSTNRIANDLLAKNAIENHTVIYTDNQTHGKGQRGNSWESLPNLNATFSIVLKLDQLKIDEQFCLHMITSLAIKHALTNKVDVTIKWPNDIYIYQKKLGGILIENSIRGSYINNSVIGIGININQTQFTHEHASSLKLEVQKNFIVKDLIETILIGLEHYLDKLLKGQIGDIKTEYTKSLYQIGEENIYETADGVLTGVITGVTKTGKLQIDFGEKIKTFDFKKVKFLRRE